MSQLEGVLVFSGIMAAIALPLAMYAANKTYDDDPPNLELAKLLVGIATLYSIYSTLMIAGGPDAKFLAASTLVLGATAGGLATLLLFVASRVLRINGSWALLMIAPTVLELVITLVIVRLDIRVHSTTLIWMLLVLPTACCVAVFGYVGFGRRNQEV